MPPPDPSVPLNLTLMLQSHVLVPLDHYRKLSFLESLWREGTIVWRGDKVPGGLPPQQQTPSQTDRAERELSEKGPVSTINAGAFMPKSPPLAEQFPPPKPGEAKQSGGGSGVGRA